jgi:hypothetical protein
MAQIVTLPVKTLVTADVSLGRVEFQVTGGRVAGAVNVTDSATGDLMHVRALKESEGALDAVLNPAVHNATPDGRAVQTDVRLLNLTAQAATVNVTALSLSDGATPAAATVQLPANQVTEIKDVLAALFAVGDAATGAVRLTSASPVAVVSRATVVNGDGSTNGFGGFQNAINLPGFTGAGLTAMLLGLQQSGNQPGAGSNAELVAGTDGATLNFTALDGTGTVLGSSGPVQLGPLQAMETPIAQLIPGVDFSTETVVQMAVMAGEAAAAGDVVDNGSSQPVYASAALAPLTACAAPAIAGFESIPAALAASGSVELDWRAGNVDTVTISPGPSGPQAATGSATVNVTATTTYKLTATGPCGSATASYTVVVGGPTLQSVTPTAAPPGTSVTLHVANLSPLSTVLGAVMTFNGETLHVPARSVSAAGDVAIVVPLLLDDTASAGYASGAATIAADFGDSQSATLPFSVQTVKVPTNSPAMLQQFLDSLATTIKTLLDKEAAVSTPALAANLTALKTAVDSDAAAVRTALTALGSAASTTITPSGATSAVTVTRNDVDMIAAFLSTRPGGLAVPSVEPGFIPRARPAGAGAPGGCLSDDPKYATCSAVYALSPIIEEVTDLYSQALKASKNLPSVINLSGIQAVLSNYITMLNRPLVLCNLYPLQFDSFHAVPNPDPLPVDEDRAYPVSIKAHLVPYFTPAQATDYFTNLLIKASVNFFNDVVLTNTNARQTFGPAIQQAYNYLGNAAKPAIGQVISSAVDWIATALERQVGECDITNVSSLDPDKVTRLDYLNAPYVQPPDYPFKGHQPGLANLFIQARGNSFFLPAPDGKHTLQLAPGDFFRNATINVDGQDELTITGVTLGAHGANGQISYPGQKVTRNGGQYIQILQDNGLYTSVTAYQNLKDNTWTVQQRISGDQGTIYNDAQHREDGAVNIMGFMVEHKATAQGNGGTPPPKVTLNITTKWNITGGRSPAPPMVGKITLQVQGKADGQAPNSFNDMGFVLDAHSQAGGNSVNSSAATSGTFSGSMLGQGFNEDGMIVTTVTVTKQQ